MADGFSRVLNVAIGRVSENQVSASLMVAAESLNIELVPASPKALIDAVDAYDKR